MLNLKENNPTFPASGRSDAMQNRNGSISTAIICSCAILSKYLVILPEYMVKYVGNAAWIDVLGKCIAGTLSLLFVLWLYKPFSPKSFTEIFSLSLGNTGAIILKYVYIIFFTLFNSFLFRLLIEALSTVMATTAPDEFFAIFVIVSVFIAAHSGIRATTNLSAVIFPLVLITVFTVVLALFPHYREENIMPFFGTDSKLLLKGIFAKHFGFTETILLFFFAPLLGNFNELKKAGIITYIIISFISVSFTLAYCLTVPYPASGDFFLPFYQMTRMIKSGAFLQRLEPIVVFVWTGFVMCSMSILIAVTSKLASSNTESTEETALVPIITIITFFVAMLPESESRAFYIYEKLLSVSTLLFPTLPVFVLTVARIRRKGLKT